MIEYLIIIFWAWYHGNLFRSCKKRLVAIPRRIAHYHPTLWKPQRLTFFHRNQVQLIDFQFSTTGFEFVSAGIKFNSNPVR